MIIVYLRNINKINNLTPFALITVWSLFRCPLSITCIISTGMYFFVWEISIEHLGCGNTESSKIVLLNVTYYFFCPVGMRTRTSLWYPQYNKRSRMIELFPCEFTYNSVLAIFWQSTGTVLRDTWPDRTSCQIINAYHFSLLCYLNHLCIYDLQPVVHSGLFCSYVCVWTKCLVKGPMKWMIILVKLIMFSTLNTLSIIYCHVKL